MQIEAIIDSQNPPIIAEHLLIGESKIGNIRLMGFSGTPYFIRKEEIESENGEKETRAWIRPTCVMEASGSAIDMLMAYLLGRLADNPEEFERIIDGAPEIKSKLVETLPELQKILEG